MAAIPLDDTYLRQATLLFLMRNNQLPGAADLLAALTETKEGKTKVKKQAKQSSDSGAQCTMILPSGKKCQGRCKADYVYCKKHTPQAAKKKAPSHKTDCLGVSESGGKCLNPCKPGYAYCKTHNPRRTKRDYCVFVQTKTPYTNKKLGCEEKTGFHFRLRPHEGKTFGDNCFDNGSFSDGRILKFFMTRAAREAAKELGFELNKLVAFELIKNFKFSEDKEKFTKTKIVLPEMTKTFTYHTEEEIKKYLDMIEVKLGASDTESTNEGATSDDEKAEE